MDPLLVEFARYGIIGLSFGVLLWATLKDKDRMAAEMNKDKRDLLAAYTANTEAQTKTASAVSALQKSLDARPCIMDRAGERA
jgi:hypothetical protein